VHLGSVRISERRLALLPMTTAPSAMPTAAIDPMMVDNSNVFMACRLPPPRSPVPSAIQS